MNRQLPPFKQEIIDYTGTESFPMKPKLAKLLQELKYTPVRCHKKSPLVFLTCLNHKLVVFGCFAAG